MSLYRSKKKGWFDIKGFFWNLLFLPGCANVGGESPVDVARRWISALLENKCYGLIIAPPRPPISFCFPCSFLFSSSWLSATVAWHRRLSVDFIAAASPLLPRETLLNVPKHTLNRPTARCELISALRTVCFPIRHAEGKRPNAFC